MSAKKATTSKGKKAAVKKAPVKKAPVKKAPAKKAPVKRAAAKKAPQSLPYEQGKWASAFAPRAPGERRYWLVKSEPDVFSFDDLMKAPGRTTFWDGVRNSSARNFMRDGMKIGDLVLYYHSNAEPSAAVGVCEVVREGYPDETAFDPSSEYYDAESVRETPMWYMVDVRGVEAFQKPVTLPAIKATPELQDMALLKVSRLSVVPVTPSEWEIVRAMGRG